MIILTSENYFSKEADEEYMSVSQFKTFEKCEAEALELINADIDSTKKTAFLEGQFFESIVTGNKQLFIAQHPEIISKRGATMGEVKADFKKVIAAAEKFESQAFFKNIIKKCEKQVILTGKICGIKIKGALDLFDKKTNSIYDIKCMKDFKETWSSKEKVYVPWYYTYNYVLQLAIYRELVRQNFGEPQEIGLLAATKEEVPDIQALKFDSRLLDDELEYFKSKVQHYDNLKKGLEKPTQCGICDYCKRNKILCDFEEVK